jgi:hypothetical protein
LYYTNPYPAFENHTLEADYQSLIQCINTFAHQQLRSCCTRTMRHPPQCRTTSLTQTEQQCRGIAAKRATDADIMAMITSAHVGHCGKGPVSTIATCPSQQVRNATDAAFDDALMRGRMGARTVLDSVAFKYD